MSNGRLITIEGLDGAGKTTLARELLQSITDAGVSRAQLLREPGGVKLSERIRELVKDPALTVGARTEALLYAAARAQLVDELVAPLLREGCWVLLDRFIDSSLAYQGAGRHLGIKEILTINLFATRGLVADRTLLLRISPATGRSRQLQRANEPDRLEREDEQFFATIASAYEDLAREEPERVRVIDAEQPPELVLDQALAAISDLFGAKHAETQREL